MIFSALSEHPLPSSRFPTWDLLRVLSLLCGSPFEPLESCSLRDLTRKTLFLLSLATARRVGELQAVSSSGGDLFLFYLPEFRAKSESSSNPLPHSFRVRSLRGPYLMSCLCIPSVRSRFIFAVLLLFLLVCGLSLSLLALLLGLFPRMH